MTHAIILLPASPPSTSCSTLVSGSHSTDRAVGVGGGDRPAVGTGGDGAPARGKPPSDATCPPAPTCTPASPSSCPLVTSACPSGRARRVPGGFGFDVPTISPRPVPDAHGRRRIVPLDAFVRHRDDVAIRGSCSGPHVEPVFRRGATSASERSTITPVRSERWRVIASNSLPSSTRWFVARSDARADFNRWFVAADASGRCDSGTVVVDGRVARRGVGSGGDGVGRDRSVAREQAIAAGAGRVADPRPAPRRARPFRVAGSVRRAGTGGTRRR